MGYLFRASYLNNNSEYRSRIHADSAVGGRQKHAGQGSGTFSYVTK